MFPDMLTQKMRGWLRVRRAYRKTAMMASIVQSSQHVLGLDLNCSE